MVTEVGGMPPAPAALSEEERAAAFRQSGPKVPRTFTLIVVAAFAVFLESDVKAGFAAWMATAFAAVFLIGCVAAVLAVRQSGVFTAVVYGKKLTHPALLYSPFKKDFR